MRRTLSLALAAAATAQSPPTNGPRSVDPGWHALVHATAVTAPGERLEDATIVVRDGLIVSVSPGGEAPAGARRWNCTGLTVFAGLIDACVPVKVAEPSQGPGRHWNTQVRAEAKAVAAAALPAETRDGLRSLGFTTAALVPESGVFRGLGAVALLADADENGVLTRDAILDDQAFHAVALDGSRGYREYPGSLMGVIALVRQTLFDAAHRATAQRLQARLGPSDALDALNLKRHGKRLPFLFSGRDELDALRAGKIAAEANLDLWLRGTGMEFRRLPAIAALGAPVVLPVDFPALPEVDRITDAERVSLRQLMTWEQAPTNPRRLDAAGIRVALTSDGLAKRKEFAARVREAIAHGLPADRALAMLTTIPAELLGIGEKTGTIARGKLANLVAVRGGAVSHPYAEGSHVESVWVKGERHEIIARESLDLAGTWSWSVPVGDPSTPAALEFAQGKLKVKFGDAEAEAKRLEIRGERIHFLITGDVLGERGSFLMSAVVEGDRMFGQATAGRGRALPWRADRRERRDEPDRERSEAVDVADVPEDLPLPFGAFGLRGMPSVQDVLVENATIWTSGPDGTIDRGVLLTLDGKVAYVGAADGMPQVDVANLAVIDAAGKHVTPGLIDCHSHTGISGGVNEGSQAVTAEVRIADVINPDDINFYRQLAGGLTAANQLHGSANPIGGQNSVVKLRWGCGHPDEMAIAGAPPGIKFALGENVKRSRSREEVTRYPRTRLGVEALIRDRFTTAREYARELRQWRSLAMAVKKVTTPPTRDLELEALVEILAGERLIHCHSYRQDEILMLCRVARDFGFKIGTFQHVLEGFKVAEAIKDAALGASSFSDWWAYKFEVFDAVPYNGEILHRVGVNVSFNSDSSELARRMNTEAAKAVKYGALSPHEALQFVTLNPAYQLGVDNVVGSLEAGKDADFVIWSGDPLSTTSRCEATWVDGRPLFSVQRDAELREAARAERLRLIQKVLSRSTDGKTRRDGRKPESDEADGTDYGCGECGCEVWR